MVRIYPVAQPKLTTRPNTINCGMNSFLVLCIKAPAFCESITFPMFETHTLFSTFPSRSSSLLMNGHSSTRTLSNWAMWSFHTHLHKRNYYANMGNDEVMIQYALLQTTVVLCLHESFAVTSVNDCWKKFGDFVDKLVVKEY